MKAYEAAEMNIELFVINDVIATSPTGEDELPGF